MGPGTPADKSINAVPIVIQSLQYRVQRLKPKLVFGRLECALGYDCVFTQLPG